MVQGESIVERSGAKSRELFLHIHGARGVARRRVAAAQRFCTGTTTRPLQYRRRARLSRSSCILPLNAFTASPPCPSMPKHPREMSNVDVLIRPVLPIQFSCAVSAMYAPYDGRRRQVILLSRRSSTTGLCTYLLRNSGGSSGQYVGMRHGTAQYDGPKLKRDESRSECGRRRMALRSGQDTGYGTPLDTWEP